MTQPYSKIEDHLRDELGLLKARLDLQLKTRALTGSAFAPLPLTPELAAAPPAFEGESRVADEGRIQDHIERLESWRARVVAMLAASAEAGLKLPLVQLREQFGLSGLELDLLLLTVSTHLEPEIMPRIAALQRGFAGDRPTVAGALSWFAGPDERLAVRDLLGPDSQLVRGGLVDLASGGGANELIWRELKTDDRVVSFLLGAPYPRGQFGAIANVIPCTTNPDKLILDAAKKEGVIRVIGRALEGGFGELLMLIGPPGSGRRTLAEVAAGAHGRRLVMVDTPALLRERAGDVVLRQVFRESKFQDGAPICFAEADGLAASPAHLAIFTQLLRLHDSPVLLTLSARPVAVMGLAGQEYVVTLEVPNAEDRKQIWKQSFPARLRPTEDELKEVSRRFNLTGGAIRSAAAEALSSARIRSDELVKPRIDELSAASEFQLTHRLGSLADRVNTALGWEDLILPDSTQRRIQAVSSYVRQRDFVLDKWGFRRKLPYGAGVSVLFFGAPGTGKTMVAGLMARELQLELFRIDLSQVVSKYIGETEKNLATVFDEAERGGAMILFDEADALFSARTEVKSSNDRYANLETNYLLQRIENFSGISILTTNFESSIDEAFKRRLTFIIEFPFPDEAQRLELWKTMFPPEARLAPTVDLSYIAESYELSGGNIKKAALRSAFAAVERYGEEGSINEECIEEAVRDVYAELGRLMPQ